jgi:hypothetical protein
VTKIEVDLYGPAVYISANFSSYTDSTSLVCGDATGTKFCGNRNPIIWDIDLNSEVLISNSTLIKIDLEKGVLIIKTKKFLMSVPIVINLE